MPTIPMFMSAQGYADVRVHLPIDIFEQDFVV